MYTNVVDYHDVIEYTKESIIKNGPAFKGHISTPYEWDWVGCTKEQMLDYIENGYEPEEVQLDNLPLPKIVPGPRFVYAEEGDELDIDLAIEGEMDCWVTRKPVRAKPGINLEIMMAFSAGMSAKVINEYAAWVAGAITALERMGYAYEISAINIANNVHHRHRDTSMTKVVLKRMMDANLNDWKLMFSAGGFRTVMFTAKCMSALDKDNPRMCRGSLGQPNVPGWGVKWDAETRTVRVECAKAASIFPAKEMSDKFGEIISNNI